MAVLTGLRKERVHMAEISKEVSGKTPETKNGYFEKFTVRDIVFLAVTAVVALVTCAVMPLVSGLLTVVYGIAQLVTGLQTALFAAVAMSKVRKPGALFLFCLFFGLFQLFMSPPMFFTTVVSGILVELLVALIFHGYKSNKAVFTAAALLTPLTLPFNYLYNLWFGKEAMVAVASKSVWMTIGMSVAVIAVSCLGAWLGLKVYKELEKSGAMKK